MDKQQEYGVIFDMDGVLINSYDAHKRSWQQMAGEYGLKMTDEQFAATFGKPSRDIIAQVWPERAEAHRISEMDDRKEQIFRDRISQQVPEMPGAMKLIHQLRQAGYKLGIGSSGPPQNVQLVTQKLNIVDLLHGTVTGMDVIRGKPDPQVFLLTAEKMNIAPSRCAVIEDAAHGIDAAKRAGMIAVGLTGTVTRAQLSHADLVVDELNELSPESLADLIDGQSKTGTGPVS